LGELFGVDVLEIVARGSGEPQLVAHEVLEDRAAVTVDRAVGFVRDDQVKVGGREKAHVLVIELQRLDGGDHDLRLAPVLAVFLVDHGLVVVFEQQDEILPGLVFELQAVDQEENAAGVAGAQEELDDRCSDERLTGAGGHFEKEAGIAIGCALLQGFNRRQLIGPQDAQAQVGDEGGALVLVLPARVGFEGGLLGDGDVILCDHFAGEGFGVGLERLAMFYRIQAGKFGDHFRVAGFTVPEVVQVAIGEDDKAYILGGGVFTRLLLAVQRGSAFALGFEDDEGEILLVQQKEVHETVMGALEILPHGVHVFLGELDIGLEDDVGFAFGRVKEAPAGFFEHLVDLYACLCFSGHARNPLRMVDT